MDHMNNELTHYGVLGMKWGVRRRSGGSGVVTARKAGQNANKAKRTARLESLKNDIERSKNGERITMYKAGKNMRKAGKKAYKESWAKDKANNKAVREQKREEKRKKYVDSLIRKERLKKVSELLRPAVKN